jgi:hypothetical protein
VDALARQSIPKASYTERAHSARRDDMAGAVVLCARDPVVALGHLGLT